jgi:undecaprenyl-diphosphatase
LNELLKVVVQRPRPYTQGGFVDWSGISFASGHTIGATLLYGQILLFVIPMLKSRASRTLAILSATVVVLLVGFGRIALGAHYFTDVLAAIFFFPFGVLWLTICFFAMKPLHRRGRCRKSLIAPDPAMALIPVPVAETTERRRFCFAKRGNAFGDLFRAFFRSSLDSWDRL